MKVLVKKLHTDAEMPKFALPGDAGMDLHSIENVIIEPGKRYACGTGVAMEIPEGYAGLIWDKSGIAAKFGIETLGGVIDSGYRGEVKVILVNLGQEDYKIEKGDKVAQILIQKIYNPEIEEVSALDDSQRGAGGFGSTGK
ncbi:MAG: dUTP diphosphatase [Candidatus Pacebacteria bacterium]|nr:dUTP diphosphatase [Candidatus Paceibacterota bacterium]MDR3583374.1 dUTP diphosphatase [Candidatus Paceibacterota bacterium]